VQWYDTAPRRSSLPRSKAAHANLQDDVAIFRLTHQDDESIGSDKIKFFATPRSAFPRRCCIAWDRNLGRRGSGGSLAERSTSKFSSVLRPHLGSHPSDNFHLISVSYRPVVDSLLGPGHLYVPTHTHRVAPFTPVSAILPCMASALDAECVRQCACACVSGRSARWRKERDAMTS
jgi:hypothetical protein